MNRFAQYRQLLATYLRPQWRRVAMLAALLLVSIGLQIFNPLVLGYFIDMAVAGGAMQTLLSAALLFIGVALVSQVVAVAETYYAEQIAWTATDALRADLTHHILDLDLGFHKRHSPGELIERVDGDVSTLATFFARFVVYVAGNLILLLGIFAVLFSINRLIGLTLAGFVVIALFTLQRTRSLAVPRFQTLRQAKAELFGFLEEHLAGAEDLRANGATGYVLRQLYPFLRTNLLQARAASLVAGIGWATTVLLFVTGTVIALALGAYLLNRTVITIGTLYLIFTYAEQLRRPIELITRHIQDLQQAAASLARIEELRSLKSVVNDADVSPSHPQLPTDTLAVGFDQVSFGYVEGAPILQEITFTLAPGQALGVLGRTGSGKTTLARLLIRFYDPDRGAICLGGTDLRLITLTDLRRRVGMVTQEVQLFDATLRDNLTFFDRTIADEHVQAVIAELGLADWYKTLPAGLETRLSPDGLSAGQAQLLALGRVFLKDPGLVILDEATARLDLATQHLLTQALVRLLAGRTAIIIAHRLETVALADLILVLEEGRIVEYGAREALARDPASHFHRLLHTSRGEVSP